MCGVVYDSVLVVCIAVPGAVFGAVCDAVR